MYPRKLFNYKLKFIHANTITRSHFRFEKTKRTPCVHLVITVSSAYYCKSLKVNLLNDFKSHSDVTVQYHAYGGIATVVIS